MKHDLFFVCSAMSVDMLNRLIDGSFVDSIAMRVWQILICLNGNNMFADFDRQNLIAMNVESQLYRGYHIIFLLD